MNETSFKMLQSRFLYKEEINSDFYTKVFITLEKNAQP